MDILDLLSLGDMPAGRLKQKAGQSMEGPNRFGIANGRGREARRWTEAGAPPSRGWTLERGSGRTGVRADGRTLSLGELPVFGGLLELVVGPDGHFDAAVGLAAGGR